MQNTAKSSDIVAIKEVELFIGGALGISYSVVYENGELVYTVSEGYGCDCNTERIHPTNRQWQSFFKKCNKINIFAWKEEYENPGILDGTQWEFRIVTNTFNFSSSGDNAYPDAGTLSDCLKYTDPFKAFLKAVSALLGGRDFR